MSKRSRIEHDDSLKWVGSVISWERPLSIHM
jgi:hypothetical protein